MEIAFLTGLVAVFMAWRAGARVKALEREVAALRLELFPQHSGVPEQQAGIRPDPDLTGATDLEPAAETPPATPPAIIPTAEVSTANPWSPRPVPVAAGAEDGPREASATASGGWGKAGQGDDAIARLCAWLRDNWIYPAAGAALVLSGVFMVQYAVETGLLTPLARVLLALVLGALLAAGGEWLRHRPVAGAILPATLAGSGIVIAMAAVLAALHLHDLVAPGTALLALAALSFGAIALGWLHGPMLAALGLIAGTVVPFVLGGGGSPPAAMFGYFTLLALTGLAIDAARRWGWVTWLALAGPLTAMILWRLAGGDATALALALVVVAGATMTLPFGRIAPLAEGPRALGRARPLPGVRAGFLASAVAAVGLALLVPSLAGPVALSVLAGLMAIWCRRAPALADQMLLPLLAFPLWIVWQAWDRGAVLTVFLLPRLPETALPLQASMVAGLAVLAGLAMLWRGEAEAPGRHAPWTLVGLALPGGALAAMETMWRPGAVLGDYVWALHAMMLAGLATGLALRYARLDAGQGPRLGGAAASAFALVALGLMLMLGQAALTLALAVLMVAAAAMDRRFDIPALGAFQVLAAMTLIWRLVLDPGLGWHIDRSGTAEALAALAGTLAGPLAALWLTWGLPQDRLRRATRLIVETTMAGATAIVTGVLIIRILPDSVGIHAMLGLQATVLIVLAWMQIRRSELPFGQRFRRGLGWFFGLLAGLALLAALGPFSPVFAAWPMGDRVAGWPLLNDLIPAYLLPGLLLVIVAGWNLLRGAGWVVVAVWAACAIRHLWQGPDLRITQGVAQGELYAYTFAILLAGAALVARALMTGRPDLRKLGLALIALAAAKAFLVDAAELDGLLRAAAFLGLGLSLAGLAWVNGWAVALERREGGEIEDERRDL